jgi:hypothetical protein
VAGSFVAQSLLWQPHFGLASSQMLIELCEQALAKWTTSNYLPNRLL